MFWGCSGLKTIYCNQSWKVGDNNSEDANMFWACSNLTNGKGIRYDRDKIGISMACPFTGYFTPKLALEGTGTETDPFQIASPAHWNMLADYVATGHNASGLYFRQTGDFEVEKMIGIAGLGTSHAAFSGIYDGFGSVLKANIDGGEELFHCAPFACIENATIKNLIVDGSVKGGNFAAGLVGHTHDDVNNICLVENCYVVASIHSSRYYAGGVVGAADYARLTIKGCVFGGKLSLGQSNAIYAGAIVGYARSEDDDCHFVMEDCFEKGEYEGKEKNPTQALGFWRNRTNVFDGKGGTNCYNTHNWSDGSFKAVEVKDETANQIVLTGDPVAYSNTLFRYANSVIVQFYDNFSYTPERNKARFDADIKLYAQAGSAFTFTSTDAITAKNASTSAAITVTGQGTKDAPYSVAVPSDAGIELSTTEKAFAIWCAGANTLYFDKSATAIADTYKGQAVTEVWSGDQVTNIGWKMPGWNNASVRQSATKVVFTEAFKDVKPRSLYGWFSEFEKLETIEGIENLNTSECTNMNSMFFSCSSLTSIDVDGFDVSKVTNATTMFKDCSNLETILCRNTWNIATDTYMFVACNRLSGAVKYSSFRVDGSMANPKTGYFTTTNFPQVLWVADVNTLYFVASKTLVSAGDTYKGHTVTTVWSNDEVINYTSSDKSPWYNYASLVQSVIIDKTFKSIKPKKMYEWFRYMSNLTEITGMENLNTSETVDMRHLFMGCSQLTTLDLRHFDMSKVSEADGMFQSCTNLTTIICNDIWSQASANMFLGCTSLKGAISYDSSKTGGSRATPITGYFTTTEGAVKGDGTEDNPIQLSNTTHWEVLSKFVAAGRTDGDDAYYSYRLANHIKTDSTMVGTEDHPFRGNFDGQGYALIVDIDAEENYAGPFRYVEGSSQHPTLIRNLVTMGTVKTSKKFAGGIVGYGKGSVLLSACQSLAEINCTVQGDGSFGGLVGYIAGTNDDLFKIDGCVFSGQLLGSSANAVGGFVGWKADAARLGVEYSLFVPEEVNVGTGNDNKTFVRYNQGTTEFTKCYYTQTLGDAQGTLVYEIDNDDEYLLLEGKDDHKDYDASGLYFGVTDETTSLMAYVIEELENEMQLDGDFRIFAPKNARVALFSKVPVTFKEAGGQEITTTGSGTSEDPYVFTMPEKNVEVEAAGKVPYAIWCDANKTLYFHASDTPIQATDQYEDKTITALWSGGDVVSTGWNAPKWDDIASDAQKVVFTSDFKDARPSSLYCWFFFFNQLETIEGIENLNTSETTVMNSAFFSCSKLTKIDVNGFDVSKVKTTSSMFAYCNQLETIFCDNTWIIPNSESINMFVDCYQLANGTVTYDAANKNASMANPNNGYFTKKELTLTNAEDNSEAIEKFEGIKNVKVTLADRILYRDGSWNTLCLPFDVTVSGSVLAQDGVTVKELDVTANQTRFDDGTLYLNFKDVSETLKAGVPYIIKWDAVENGDIEDPEFTGDIISSQTPVTSADDAVSFVGTYDPVRIGNAGDNTKLYLGDENFLYWPSGEFTIGSQRAYFQLNGFTVGEQDSSNPNAAIRAFVLNFGDGKETTGIATMDYMNVTDKADGWFTLDGRKLSGQPTVKGVYIKNGKKMFVK